MDVTVNQPPGTVYLMHAVGRSDLGIRPSENDHEQRLLSRLDGADIATIRQILLLRLDDQTAGDVAPIESALATLTRREALDRVNVHLVLTSTPLVRGISTAIERALIELPDLYGRSFDQITIVESPSLDEADVANRVHNELARLGPTSDDRAVVLWGSGSTQLMLGALDAVIDAGLPWSLVSVSPDAAARHILYDPTAALPVDPLVPLLRRWRYHDLLQELTQRNEITLTDAQQQVIEAEAEQWGRAYVEPNASRLRALMAGALMRGDGSSGFAVRAYILHRYAELREQDGSQLDLLEWAERKKGEKATLGRLLGAIRKGSDVQVSLAKGTVSGRWLLDPVVSALNDMGALSSHELKPPKSNMIESLRQHLAECRELSGPDQATDDDLTAAGLNPLNLVPGLTAWYVLILGTDRPGTVPYPAQLAEALRDEQRWDRVDPMVRAYLGVPSEQAMRAGMLILGTESLTAAAASQLAERLDRSDLRVVSGTIPDGPGRGDGLPGPAITEEQAAQLLQAHLGDDAGALVLVPTATKQHVLPVLMAGQRIAAQRGIPLFLRQMVTREQTVVDAGTHRLPLRFGTDLGILSAALRALDLAELDTAARLLGAIPAGRDLATRVAALSYALRCDMDEEQNWPAEITLGRSMEEWTIRLLAERIEVWATLPNLAGDVAVESRAILGACTAIEASIKKCMDDAQRRAVRKTEPMGKLFDVRDGLQITHPDRPLSGDVLDGLVQDRTQQVFTSAAELLSAMVGRARAFFGTPVESRRRLVQLLDSLRDEVRALRDEERARRTEADRRSGAVQR